MKYLLDAYNSLWAALDARKLSKNERAAIEQPHADLFISSASLWEIGILQGLKRIQLTVTIREVADLAASELGSDLLPLEPEHIDRMKGLPFHHRDPFDRMVIAQALNLKAGIIGKDPWFDAYGVQRIW